MRKDLYTFIHWAIEKASAKHQNSIVTFDELNSIVRNVWDDMVENGEIDGNLLYASKVLKYYDDAEY